MSTDEEDFARNAVNHALAKAQIDSTARYLSEGRQFAELSDDDLNDTWVEAFKGWVRDAGARKASDDADAEMSLRKMEPPLHLVNEEFEMLQERAKARANASDAVDEIGGKIIKDFIDAKRHQN